ERAEAVGPGQRGAEAGRAGRLALPEDGVGLAHAGGQRVDAELDPLAGAVVQGGREPGDACWKGHGLVVAEGGRAGRLDRPWGVPGGELDQPALRDPGDAAVVDVDGLVDDRVQAVAGPGGPD